MNIDISEAMPGEYLHISRPNDPNILLDGTYEYYLDIKDENGTVTSQHIRLSGVKYWADGFVSFPSPIYVETVVLTVTDENPITITVER